MQYFLPVLNLTMFIFNYRMEKSYLSPVQAWVFSILQHAITQSSLVKYSLEHQ